jgi:hypothetical protein
LALYRRAVGELTSVAVESYEHTKGAPNQRWQRAVRKHEIVPQQIIGAFQEEVDWGAGESMRIDSQW